MSDVSSSVPIRVLVLGHSFVHRLQEFLGQSSQWQSNLNLAAAGHNVYFFGRGGLQFSRLLQLLSQACAPIYDLVVLEFGTNDLGSGCQLNYCLTGPSRWHRHCSKNIVSSRWFLWKFFHALRVNTHARPRLTLRLANTTRHCADRYLPTDVYTFTTTTVW